MNNENHHPEQRIPPNTHALHRWDQSAGALYYEYNGADVLKICPADGCEPGFRHGSDGSMQSLQTMQQLYLQADRPSSAVVTVTLHAGAGAMRPERAGGNRAILGRLGNSLPFGVNGLYDPQWDLLIDWHGCNWHWLDDCAAEQPDGSVTARFVMEYSRRSAFINLRPHYYRTHLGYSTHQPWQRRPNQKAVAGWCSWEAYRRSIDQDKISHIASFMAAALRDYGLEYIQVDDGYQRMPIPHHADGEVWRGWLTCEPSKFPDGHSGIVNSITERGLVPAIWTNANITNSEFPELHPGDVIWHEGRPLKGEWIDYLYSCTPECLAKHVTPLFEQLRTLGYRYVKIDAIRHLLFDGLHECVRLGIMSSEEASQRFRAYMEATRRGLGDEVYYLASWGELHEVIGVADACRISMDANPTWAGIRMQLFESARWYHTQRILFLNDPDHVCVRTNPDWARSVLSLISLSGQLYMLSDTPDAYTPEKLDIIRRTLPPLATATAETGPLSLDYPAYTWTKLHGFAVQSSDLPVAAEVIDDDEALDMAGSYPTMDDDHPFSTLWAFHLCGAQGSWCVMARIATTPLAASTVPMQSLGLDPDKTYLAFDFWQRRFLGEVRGGLACDALPLGHCSIIALQELANRPQLIASDRHVSMDAVSVAACACTSSSMQLTLNGVANERFNYYLHLPRGLSVSRAEAHNAEVTIQTDGCMVTVEVLFTTASADVMIILFSN